MWNPANSLQLLWTGLVWGSGEAEAPQICSLVFTVVGRLLLDDSRTPWWANGQRHRTPTPQRSRVEAEGEQARQSYLKSSCWSESRRIGNNWQVKKTLFSDNGRLGSLDVESFLVTTLLIPNGGRGISTPSNYPILHRHQSGTLQFNSILTLTTQS